MESIALNKYWWALVLRGILGILFAGAAFFWPGVTLAVLVLWIGAYFLVDGIFTLIAAFRAAGHHQRWWVLLLEALLSIAAGIITFFMPGMTALVLIYIIAAWALVTGVFEIAGAITAPWPASSKWLMGLSGVISILFGILVWFRPLPAGIAIIWILGAYALAFGIVLLVLGIRLKSSKLTLATA